MEDNLMSSLSNILNNRLPDSVITDDELERPFRNLIINGAMQVAQRGTSTTGITAGGYYTADRWFHQIGTLGTWTDTVENDAPTGSGFAKSLKVLCTTADAALAAGDINLLEYKIEGQNLQAIRKGTSNAQQVTLQFWVKSNVTGTYIVNFFDTDNNRIVSSTYTVASSGVWEKKTIVFPADTTGAFDNDNNSSVTLAFWLGAGTDFSSGTLNTTWATRSNTNRAVGQTNLAAATNNYWQITGVQLEVGAVATPFEFKPFAQELRECLRYFQKSFAYATTPAEGQTQYGSAAATTSYATAIPYIYTKYINPFRATPTTITLYNPRAGGATGQITNAAADGSSTAVVNSDEKGFMVQSAGQGANNWYIHWTASSEL
jgi:hypothetical protein